jgi:23S rRNA (guanine2445-N2)-methyltransferase
MKFFATTAKGTEDALADELRELGIARQRRVRGGVSFGGRFEDAWRVCLASRIAVRVLLTLQDAPCRSSEDLYRVAREIAWERHVSPETTISVSAVGNAPGLDNTMFVAQRTKDAVVDVLRERVGARPSVSRDDPDVAIFVRLARGRVGISLDLAGESLHRRGFREESGPAPLKETLAAALLRLSGWDRARPLVDPMCGSATLAIEADHWARGVAPGMFRQRLGFERWASFERGFAKRLRILRERLAAAALAQGPPILATDADPEAIRRAARAVARADAQVELRIARMAALAGTDPPGLVILNPPYGERLAQDTQLSEEISEALGRLPRGHRVALLGGPRSGFRAPDSARRFALMNGPLECAFFVWDVV